jgi:SAM-dependent methyltransferase
VSSFIFFVLYSIVFIAYAAAIVFMVYTIYAAWSGAPYVPMLKRHIDELIAFADIKMGDRFVDLGSGDGRVVRAAARAGADALGVEINPMLFWWSRCLNLLHRTKNARIIRKNLWDVDISDCDVLSVFFISHFMGKLKEKILREMKPGTRVVSYGFRFPDWPEEAKDDKVYLYVIHPSRRHAE